MVFIKQMYGSNYFVSFAELCACLAVQCPLQILNLSQLFQGGEVLVRLQTQQGNVPFDFAGFGMHFTVVVFVNFLDNSEWL